MVLCVWFQVFMWGGICKGAWNVFCCVWYRRMQTKVPRLRRGDLGITGFMLDLPDNSKCGGSGGQKRRNFGFHVITAKAYTHSQLSDPARLILRFTIGSWSPSPNQNPPICNFWPITVPQYLTKSRFQDGSFEQTGQDATFLFQKRTPNRQKVQDRQKASLFSFLISTLCFHTPKIKTHSSISQSPPFSSPVQLFKRPKIMFVFSSRKKVKARFEKEIQLRLMGIDGGF